MQTLHGKPAPKGSSMTDFDSRLVVLERHAASTEKRLDGVDSKLDAIMAALNKAEAAPRYNPAAIVGFIKDASILVGLAAAAIVYVASAHIGTDMALLNYKVAQITRQMEPAPQTLSWRADVERR
jgi:hypothetical protein